MLFCSLKKGAYSENVYVVLCYIKVFFKTVCVFRSGFRTLAVILVSDFLRPDKWTIFIYHHLLFLLFEKALPSKCVHVFCCPIKISTFSLLLPFLIFGLFLEEKEVAFVNKQTNKTRTKTTQTTILTKTAQTTTQETAHRVIE